MCGSYEKLECSFCNEKIELDNSKIINHIKNCSGTTALSKKHFNEYLKLNSDLLKDQSNEDLQKAFLFQLELMSKMNNTERAEHSSFKLESFVNRTITPELRGRYTVFMNKMSDKYLDCLGSEGIIKRSCKFCGKETKDHLASLKHLTECDLIPEFDRKKVKEILKLYLERKEKKDLFKKEIGSFEAYKKVFYSVLNKMNNDEVSKLHNYIIAIEDNPSEIHKIIGLPHKFIEEMKLKYL